MTRAGILSKLKERLPDKALEHCLRTEETARRLAEKTKENPEKAALAGLLHDCAKSMSFEALIEEAKNDGWELLPEEAHNPYLIHAQIGAKIAARDFGITDKGILDAIATHTLGSPNMTLLQKIIYLADMIEPARNFPGVENLRQLSEKNFEKAFCHAVATVIAHLVESKKVIHPLSIEVWNQCVALPDHYESMV